MITANIHAQVKFFPLFLAPIFFKGVLLIERSSVNIDVFIPRASQLKQMGLNMLPKIKTFYLF
jgi:hypothetical protein